MGRPSLVVAGVVLPLAVLGAAVRAHAAPLFLNGVVLKADVSAARISIERPGQKPMALPVEGAARSMLPSLNRGDRVILAGPQAADRKTLRAVTEIRKGGEAAGTVTGRRSGPAVAAPPSSAPASVETPLKTSAQPPLVVVETAPSLPSAPAGAVPLEVVNNPIPSVPKAPPRIEVIVPPPAAAVGVVDEPDAASAQAARDFDGAVSVLAFRADDLDRRWAAYTQLCSGAPAAPGGEGRGWARVLRGNEPSPSDDGCRGSLAEVSDLATRFRQELDGIAETARRAGVLPGRLRASLARVNLESVL